MGRTTGIAAGLVRKEAVAAVGEGAQRWKVGFHREFETSSGSACSLQGVFQEVLECRKVGEWAAGGEVVVNENFVTISYESK